MKTKKVKELMLPLDDYAVVNEDATLLDAVRALREAQKRLPEGRQPSRAILVTDKTGKIIGKLGHLAFLKALEPRYNLVGDLPTLAHAGLSSDFINMMMDRMSLWEGDFMDICKRAKSVKVKDAMRSVTECIDEEAPLNEAIHNIIVWQTLSILVKRGNQIVGILRLSDLYDEMSKLIEMCTERGEA
jgi:predicted transcriptional regulator